ncbi:MAG: cupin domain-containing protein [Bacillota bacterium]
MEIANLEEKIVFVEQPFAKRVIYQDDNIVTFVLNFKPGQALPSHTHYDSTVIILVQTGAGELTADDRTVTIQPGSIISLKGNEKLSVKNTSQENLTLYVNMAPRPADNRYNADIG